MAQVANFRMPRPGGDNPRAIAEMLRGALGGKLNCTGAVTLAANAATTTVLDNRVSASSVILFMATSDTAITAMGVGIGVKTRTAGTSFVITHPNTADTDKTIEFVILG